MERWQPGFESAFEVSLDTEERQTFYQQRLALFALAMCSVSAVFFGLWNLALVGLYPSVPLGDVLGRPGNFWHLGATFLLFAGWLSIPRLRVSKRGLALIDGGLITAVTVTYAVMGYASRRPGTRVELVVVMIYMLFQLARAVIVPSTPRRTGVIGGLASIPPVILGSLLGSDVPPMPWPADPTVAELAGPSPNVYVAVFILLWCATTVAIATLASRIVYGLRQQVREARELGHYRLDEKLGEGGMGAVYKAHHALLRRPTVLKLLPPEKAGAHNISRFEREVRVSSRLTHPNNVAIYDYGRTPDGIFYYAMEYLEGIDLQALVELDGPQDPSRVVHVLVQVCGALAEAHEVNLVHRDVKPANIILCERGGVPDTAKVVDFGLVKEIESNPAPLLASGVNTILGTPMYLSPEAINEPDRVDARSDLYALGAVAYFLLSAVTVFTGKTIVEICAHHLHTTPVPPSTRLGRELPKDLEAVVLKCLEKDPARRIQSARELKDALLRLAIPPWSEAQARRWWSERRDLRLRPTSTKAGTDGITIPIDLKRRIDGSRAVG